MEHLGQTGDEMSSLRGRADRDAEDREIPADRDGGEVAAAMEGTSPEVELTCELPRIGWTGERIARLAYLVGIGKSANEISFDPLVAATPNAIYKIMSRLNLRFRDVPHSVLIRLNPVDYAALDAEADRRRMTPDGVADRVVKHCIRDKLYGAIIDG